MRSGYSGFCFAQDAGDLGEEGLQVGLGGGLARAAQAFDFVESAIEGLGFDGLEEVVDGVYTEGLERVLVVRGGEDDDGLRWKAGEDLEAVEARHLKCRGSRRRRIGR